jgi:glyoxylase-like metal-dependent hydrolase (beta-lactamase superfamily II)
MKKYSILHPAVFKLDGGAMFGIIPKPLWSKSIQADELNRIQLSLRVMLIQTPHKNILVDTGIGDYHGEKFDQRFGVQGPKNPLVEELRSKHQLRPEDITDLIVTHLHFDHIGGLGAAESVQIFPNATLHIHRQHYEYALKPTVRDAGSFQQQYFLPLIEAAAAAGKVHWVEGEEGLLLADGEDRLWFKCSHGHTPYLLHPYDEKFIYMADLVPTSHHIPIPWVMGYDISPGITTQDKERFYRFITEKDLAMVFEHDMEVWGAKLKNENGEFKLEKAYRVNSSDLPHSGLSFD